MKITKLLLKKLIKESILQFEHKMTSDRISDPEKATDLQTIKDEFDYEKKARAEMVQSTHRALSTEPGAWSAEFNQYVGLLASGNVEEFLILVSETPEIAGMFFDFDAKNETYKFKSNMVDLLEQYAINEFEKLPDYKKQQYIAPKQWFSDRDNFIQFFKEKFPPLGGSQDYGIPYYRNTNDYRFLTKRYLKNVIEKIKKVDYGFFQIANRVGYFKQEDEHRDVKILKDIILFLKKLHEGEAKLSPHSGNYYRYIANFNYGEFFFSTNLPFPLAVDDYLYHEDDDNFLKVASSILSEYFAPKGFYFNYYDETYYSISDDEEIGELYPDFENPYSREAVDRLVQKHELLSPQTPSEYHLD